MIASIDSTSRGSADWDVELSGIGSLSTKFKHLHRRVMPGNTANSATSQGARSAEKHILVSRLDTPRADLLSALRNWKRWRVMNNVPVVHPKRILDIHRAFAFDARAAITRQSQATFDRFFQPLIDAGQIFFLSLPAHFLIIPHKQAPRRVQAEERHRVKALCAQLRRENAIISQRVAIDFARHFFRQSAA